MSDNKQHIIYSRTDIENYLQGKMSKDEMHTLERNALHDSFLADAIEGYRFADSSTSTKNLDEITTQILSQKEDVKIISFTNKISQWLTIAASIILIVGASWIGFLLLTDKNEKAIASNEKIDIAFKPQNATIPADTSIRENTVAANTQKSEIKEGLTQPKTVAKNDLANGMAANKPVSTSTLDEATISVPYGTEKMSKTVGTSMAVTAKDNAKQEVATISVDKVLEGKGAGVAASSGNNRQIPTTFAAKKSVVNSGEISLSKADSLLVPVNGWSAFNNYLQRHQSSINKVDSTSSFAAQTKSINSDKTVGLEFEVDSNGTPQKINVTKSIDNNTDAKAIELLKNGPKWINNNNNTNNNNKQKAKIVIKVP